MNPYFIGCFDLHSLRRAMTSNENKQNENNNIMPYINSCPHAELIPLVIVFNVKYKIIKRIVHVIN